VLIPRGYNEYTFRSGLFDLKNIGDVVLRTSDYYIRMFQDFFHPNVGKWNFAPLITKAFALTFCVTGFILRILKKPDIIDWLTMGFIGIILVYPNTTQGFRYLLPVFPFLLYYMVNGLMAIRFDINLHRNVIVVFISLLILLQYKPGIHQIISSGRVVTKGPQEPEAIETWNYIRSNTDSTDVFIFIKPRAFSLYTGRRAMANNPRGDRQTMIAKFNEVKPDYYLLTNDLPNAALENYLDENTELFQLAYQNMKFKLYGNK
jgi:hypothetical protein